MEPEVVKEAFLSQNGPVLHKIGGGHLSKEGVNGELKSKQFPYHFSIPLRVRLQTYP